MTRRDFSLMRSTSGGPIHYTPLARIVPGTPRVRAGVEAESSASTVPACEKKEILKTETRSLN